VNAIAVEHLTKRFGGITAVRDVSFGIPAGQVVAVLGARPTQAGPKWLLRPGPRCEPRPDLWPVGPLTRGLGSPGQFAS
jgi:hypothetical protein